MKDIVLLILGVCISVAGIITMTGNISALHSYHRRKVKEEDIPKYGKFMGAGTLIIGLSLVSDYFLQLAGYSEDMKWLIAVTIGIGLAIMLYAQFKYNKGIF